jgi:PAS domain S-box-containing protein
MYQTIFENAGIAMAIIEKDMSISLINDEFSRLSGYTRKDIEGKKSWTDFFAEDDLYKMNKYYKQRNIISNDHTWKYDAWLIAKDKRIRDVVISLTTVQDTDKKIASLADITEYKQADELYRTLANSLQIGVYVVQDRVIVFVNPHIPRYSGYSVEELLGSDILSYVHPEDREMVRKNAIRMIKSEQSSPYDYRITDRNGQVRWLMESVVPIYYRGKRAILGNTMDITEIKETKKELEKQKMLESSILASVPHALFGFENRRIIFVNAAVERVFGWKPEEIIGKNTRILFRSDEEFEEMGNAVYTELENKAIDIRKPRFPYIRKDGKEIYCRAISSRIGDILAEKRVVTTFEDITETLEIQERLSRSEKLYRTLFETTGAATVIIDEDMTILMANEEFESMTGYTKQEVEGKKWPEFVEQEDLERMKEYHQLRRIDPNIPPRNYEFSFIDKYGNVREILSTVSIIPETKRSVASFLDISDLKRLHNEIRESEAKYRLLAENISDVIWTMDTNLKPTYMSSSVEKLRGYSADEAMKQTISEILTPASYETAINAYRQGMAREQAKQGDLEGPTTLELEMIRKDGSTIHTEVNMTFLRDQDGRITEILGVTRDITQRKLAEEELELKSRHLEETNTALKVLLKHLEKDNEELQETILSNVRELIMPFIDKVKTCRLKSDQENYVNILETNLNNIISPFIRNLRLDQCNLTPKEIQIANLIKEGKTTQEIANLLHLSLRTINFHRENIRKKLSLTNTKTNLQSYLSSLS